jgi:hypothetical protein
MKSLLQCNFVGAANSGQIIKFKNLLNSQETNWANLAQFLLFKFVVSA